MNRSTPSVPMRAKPLRSVMRPSRGSWSILKSPVCSTVPPTVRMKTARASGMEWLTAKNSRSKLPMRARSPSVITSSAVLRMRCSRSLPSRRARVSVEPHTGMSLRRRRRWGTAPMWSSWPWVRTMPMMSSMRSARWSRPGRIRSTPGWSSSGKSTPQSTSRISPSISKQVMLRPTSPSPPSGMIRRVPGARVGGVINSAGTGKDCRARIRGPRWPARGPHTSGTGSAPGKERTRVVRSGVRTTRVRAQARHN